MNLLAATLDVLPDPEQEQGLEPPAPGDVAHGLHHPVDAAVLVQDDPVACQVHPLYVRRVDGEELVELLAVQEVIGS